MFFPTGTHVLAKLLHAEGARAKTKKESTFAINITLILNIPVMIY